MRVVVVGAGLAGLSAADSLSRAGVEVELIEAGRRVGGRTRTVRDRFAHGQYAESGAEWVDTTHLRMHELMDRYGIRVHGEGMQWTTIRRWLFWDDHLRDERELPELEPGLAEAIEAYEESVDRHAEEMLDASRPQDHPRATELDALSLADMMRRAELGPAASLFARRNSQGEFASEPERVSVLFVAQQRAQENEVLARTGIELRAHRVAGGVSAVAERLADEVTARPNVRLRSSTAVTRIVPDVDGARVSTNEGDIDADHVVLAAPLRAVGRMEIADLPPLLREAIDELGYGTITKTAVQFASRQWRPGYGTTASVSQRLYDCSVEQGGEAGILMSYCGGDGGDALGDSTEDERIAAIAADMRVVHGIAGSPVGAFSRSWTAKSRYGGAYAVYEPGQVTRYWEVLRQPVGRLHLAGEHVATCTGYMEGAVESGRTAAERIIAG